MEKQTLFMALAALMLIVGFFQAMQIGSVAGRLEKLQAASSALPYQAAGAQAQPALAGAGASAAPAGGIGGYAKQVGGC